MNRRLTPLGLVLLLGCPPPDDSVDSDLIETDPPGETDDTDPVDPPGPDTRPANSSCVAFGRPPQLSGVDLVRSWPDVSISALTSLTPHPEGGFVGTAKAGQIYWWPDADDASTTLLADVASRIDTSANEMGLLGLAFHPDYDTNKQVILSYTDSPTGQRRSRITRVTANTDKTLDLSTETQIFAVDQPAGNHNGGHVAFGPDGHLYAAYGDGGGGGDPFRNGQNTDTVLGSIIRLDIDGGSPYAIPADNPFADGGGAAEIFAWGLRNPWKFQFDPATGRLWAADVGQNRIEEVDIVELGGNYGWPIEEGSECYDASECDDRGLIDPVAEYDHGLGRSITGGVVYRGSAVPGMVGSYLYGDFGTGRIWRVARDADTGEWTDELLRDGNEMRWSTFAQDPDGEAIIADYFGRGFWRFTPSDGGGGEDFPQTLSQTGCTDPADVTAPAAGLIPYGVNHSFWSDGAEKRRWLAIPDGTTVTAQADGDWTFPVGSVLGKEFSRGGERLSTRLMVHHDDGWAGYTYRWRADLSDADYVDGGVVDAVSGGDWLFPGTGDCRACHTPSAGDSLGLETRQLAGPFDYGDGIGDQLEVLTRLGLVEGPGLTDPDPLPARDDSSATTPERARAWLHANCAPCHRPETGAGSQDWRWETPLPDTFACDVEPSRDDLGIEGARLVAPGDPGRSVLLTRIRDAGLLRMPPIGSLRVDTEGAALVEAWITGLSSCDEDR